eukprot:697255-Alexandrium_andersonii.AAC.1
MCCREARRESLIDGYDQLLHTEDLVLQSLHDDAVEQEHKEQQQARFAGQRFLEQEAEREWAAARSR